MLIRSRLQQLLVVLVCGTTPVVASSAETVSVDDALIQRGQLFTPINASLVMERWVREWKVLTKEL